MNIPENKTEKIIEVKNDEFYFISKRADWILDKIPFGWKIYNFYYDAKIYLISTYQKFRYGVSDKECWDLSNNFTNYILPRLKHFKKMDRFGFPVGLTEEQWEATLDEIIWSFEYAKDPDVFNPIPEHWQLKNESLADFLNREKTSEEKKCNEEYLEKCKELEEKRKKGFQLFVEYYQNLWY